MMKRISVLVLIAALAVLVVGSAAAQGASPSHSEPDWQVSYWNNTTLSGEPALTRVEANLDWDWGTGSPHASIGADYFSARWKRLVDLPAGRYRFTAAADDGIRVYVDGRLIIDAWYVRPVQTYRAEIDLAAGHHQIVVEYFENTGLAVARLHWEIVGGQTDAWRGSYFNNRALSGSPTMIRDDKAIDFDWGPGSPGGGINVDNFSVRWTRDVDFAAGTYRFTARSDDGIRVYVDGRLVIDHWYDHAVTTFHADVNLSAGRHSLIVEYYENGGLAVARVSWEQITGTFSHWRGEYYNNLTLSGAPVLVRDDANISFDWGYGSPGAGVNSDVFSARWTRRLQLPAGFYDFTARTDDGVRLWVNDHLLIDRWVDQAATVNQARIYLSGNVDVKMEYFERVGHAVAQLSWQMAAGDVPSGTAIIVDDTDPGFVRGGSATGWRTAPEGHNGRLTWTRNNDYGRLNYNWARWYPQLSSGRYELFAYIPDRYTTTSNARYWVSHRDGFTLRTVDQSTNGGRWVSLGTYNFRGTSLDYVSLSDITYETYLSRLIAFDAVRFEKR
jgi:hypothetical protein